MDRRRNKRLCQSKCSVHQQYHTPLQQLPTEIVIPHEKHTRNRWNRAMYACAAAQIASVPIRTGMVTEQWLKFAALTQVESVIRLRMTHQFCKDLRHAARSTPGIRLCDETSKKVRQRAAPCPWDQAARLIRPPMETRAPVRHKRFTTVQTCRITPGLPTLSIPTRRPCRILSNTVPAPGRTLVPSIPILKFRWAGETPTCDGMTVNGT